MHLQISSSSYQAVVIADSPVSFWPLHETSGTLIHDIVGTNNGAAINTGSLTLGAPGILYSNGVTSDTSIAFNPTSSGTGYIMTPASGTTFASNITDPLTLSVEGWFDMPSSFAGGAPNLCMISCDTTCAQGWAWIINNANSSPQPQGWLAEAQSAGWQQNNFGTGYFPNKWTYYAATYDGTTYKLYTNGVLASSAVCGYNPAQTFDRGPLIMGAYDEVCPATPSVRGSLLSGRHGECGVL